MSFYRYEKKEGVGKRRKEEKKRFEFIYLADCSATVLIGREVKTSNI